MLVTPETLVDKYTLSKEKLRAAQY